MKVVLGTVFVIGVVVQILALDDKFPWLEQIFRQEELSYQCDNLGLRQKKVKYSQMGHILVDHEHKLLYCYIPKVACTNWKRVLMVLTNKSNVSNLMDIPGNLAHAENSTIKLSKLDRKTGKACLRGYTKFMMVRHPFERLLSAYRNKFAMNYTSSRQFQMKYGRYIIKKHRKKATKEEIQSGDSVTFREFVLYLLNGGLNSNEHWMPMYNLCHPCGINYMFIGHYETLSQDTETVLNMINAPPIVFPATRVEHTNDKLRIFFQELSIFEIQQLYKLYEYDFKLFGYGLEELLGYDLA